MILNFHQFNKYDNLLQESSGSGDSKSWWILDPSKDIQGDIITKDQVVQEQDKYNPIIKNIKANLNSLGFARINHEVNGFWTADFSKAISYWKYGYSGYTFPSGNKSSDKICKDLFKTIVYNRRGKDIQSRIRDVVYRPNIIQQAWSSSPINDWANKYASNILSNRQNFWKFNSKDLSFLNSTKGLEEWEISTIFSEKNVEDIFKILSDSGSISSTIPPGYTDRMKLFYKLKTSLDVITKMDNEKIQKFKIK